HPCHATHTRPLESVVAAGSISDPGAEEMRAVAPGLPFSTTRAQMSKLPLSLADQNTHGLPLPSMAMATPQISAGRCDGDGIAPRTARVFAQQDLVAAGLGRHIFEVVRCGADSIVIRVVPELQIGKPDIAGRVSRRRWLILLLRVVG